MTGRLFDVVDGKDTEAFWTLREFWDAATGRTVIQQFGAAGATGLGHLRRDGDQFVSDQTFCNLDGSTHQVMHTEMPIDEDSMRASSFGLENGERVLRRTYTWQRVGQPGK